MIDEDLTPEEERARMPEIEVKHIKRKYGDVPITIGRMKYYPYHPDKNYDDDENSNPYDYGFGEEDDGDEEDNTWWRK